MQDQINICREAHVISTIYMHTGGWIQADEKVILLRRQGQLLLIEFGFFTGPSMEEFALRLLDLIPRKPLLTERLDNIGLTLIGRGKV
ncbi:hypothetical protein D1872_324770 [compost metagenome]